MRYLRIGVILVFVLAFVCNVGASYYYERNHDSTMPVIKSEQDLLELSVESTGEELLAGLTAWDEKDGDLTDQIMVAGMTRFQKAGVCKVEYVVFDSDHNSASLTRQIRYTDYHSPQFVVTEPLVYRKGQNVNFLNDITAQDVLDGDLTGKIRVKSSYVSSYEAGVYPVQLEVSNSYGDKVTVDLSVTVTDGETDRCVLLKEYVTYLEKGEQWDPYTLIEKAVDLDGDKLSPSKVHVMGNVDYEEPGCYQLIYYVDGSSAVERTYLTVVVTGEAE